MKPLTAISTLVLPVLSDANVNCSTSHPVQPTVTTHSGPIAGVSVDLPGANARVNKFLGVPYAAPPERFALPKEPGRWSRTLNASEFGPSCRQLYADNPVGPEDEILRGLWGNALPESEDCLYINAFAPAAPGPAGGRAVLLFIHGGAFQQGNGIIDLSGFAAYEDVVAFSFSYRTNGTQPYLSVVVIEEGWLIAAVFGFPNSPYIPLEEKNLGLHDQRMAIEWVQKNAAVFGGDPKKVTIWGESAGAMSVDAHINAYSDDADPPPFRGGIMFSGQMSVGILGSAADSSNSSHWDAIAATVGCESEDESQLACMRNVSDDDLLDAMAKEGVAFMPVRDNVTLLSSMGARWRSGQNAKVPMLTGTIAQEGRLLINRNITMDAFLDAYLGAPLVTPGQQKQILSYYENLPDMKTDFDVASAVNTDYWWQCPQAILANTAASVGNPTWRFYFNASVTPILPEEYGFLGKFHSSDVVLLFRTPTSEGDADDLPLTPQLYTFANYLRGVVGRFVGNPAGGPGWPQVGSKYAPYDAVTLGDAEDVKAAGATPVNQTELDKRCELFKDIYPVIDRVTNGWDDFNGPLCVDLKVVGRAINIDLQVNGIEEGERVHVDDRSHMAGLPEKPFPELMAQQHSISVAKLARSYIGKHLEMETPLQLVADNIVRAWAEMIDI